MPYTPGPWVCESPSGFTSASWVFGNTESNHDWVGELFGDKNLDLVTAAPELLNMVAALVGLLEDENRHQFIAKALQEGKALWEKASGETWKDEKLEEDEVEVEVEVEGKQP